MVLHFGKMPKIRPQSCQAPQYVDEMESTRLAIEAHLGKRVTNDDSVSLPIYYKKSTAQFHVYTNFALRMRGVYVPKELYPDAPGRLLLILKPF